MLIHQVVVRHLCDGIILHFENLFLLLQGQLYNAHIVFPMDDLQGLGDHFSIYLHPMGCSFQSRDLASRIILDGGEKLMLLLCINLNWLELEEFL